MATFNKFQAFVEDLAHGEHDLETDQLVVALTAAANAPAATDSVLTDLTEIANYANLSGSTPRNITTSASSQTSGTYKLVLTDLVLTASDTVGPFRYVVIYNDDHASDGLIGYFDYGSEVTLASGETFTVDFDGTNGLLQLA
jgi:hypothetical protein